MEFSQRILLVEDQALIALTEKRLLQKHGFEVVLANTGEQAIEAVDANIDLILMDIDLGAGIDGTVAAERILAQYNIPLVFLSSHTEPEIVQKTEGITAYGYIVKNTGDTVLLAGIRMALKLYESEKAVEHNERLYRTLMENSIDGVKLINSEGRILNANQAAADMIGYTREELLTMSIPDLDPDYSRERFMSYWNDKKSLSSSYLRTTHRHRAGHLIPVQVNVIRFELDGEQLMFGISRELGESNGAETPGTAGSTGTTGTPETPEDKEFVTPC